MTCSHLLHECQNLRRSSLSRQFLLQFSVSRRLAPFQTVYFPNLRYPAGRRHPHLQEVLLDLLSLSNLGLSSFPFLLTCFHPPLIDPNLHCHVQLEFLRHHLLHVLSTLPTCETDHLVQTLVRPQALAEHPVQILDRLLFVFSRHPALPFLRHLPSSILESIFCKRPNGVRWSYSMCTLVCTPDNLQTRRIFSRQHWLRTSSSPESLVEAAAYL